ncbi:MAG: hypothetical protein IT458_08600 [Planctomycetes bacterium]|nr:hypothetical protein [Planctomycetota bacterium]
MRLPLLLLVLVLPSPATAQRTYVVDVQNRPGTHFTDLGAAFAAVQHGDIVLVRSSPTGVPAPAAPLTKGIALMGYPGAYVGGGFGSEAGPITGTLRVRGIPAGQRVQVKSVVSPAAPGIPPGQGAFIFESCQGQILIDAVSMGTEFHDCADVTVCRQSFIYNVKVMRSRLRLSQSYVRALHPSPGMIAVDSEITMGGSSSIDGADGYIDQNTCRILGYPVEGVRSSNSTFILSKYSLIYGGGIYYPFPHPCNVVIGAPALVATTPNGGIIVRDPESRLGPTQGSFQIYTRTIPSIRGYVGSPGLPENEFEIVTVSHQGARTWLFVSLPGPQTFLGLGGMSATWLDLSTTVFVGSGIGDGEGFWRSPVIRFPPLPNAVPILFQAVAEGPTGLELSVPALFVYQHGLR